MLTTTAAQHVHPRVPRWGRGVPRHLRGVQSAAVLKIYVVCVVDVLDFQGRHKESLRVPAKHVGKRKRALRLRAVVQVQPFFSLSLRLLHRRRWLRLLHLLRRRWLQLHLYLLLRRRDLLDGRRWLRLLLLLLLLLLLFLGPLRFGFLALEVRLHVTEAG